MANSITTSLKKPQSHPDKPCVYRMNFGKRYFIWKGKNLQHSLKTISKDLGRNTEKLPSEENLFYSMAAYMKRFRVFHITVDVLLETDDHQELLNFEQRELARCQGDPDCCNTVFVPHVPAWMAAAPVKIPAPEIKKAQPVKETSNKAPEPTEETLPDIVPVKAEKVSQKPEKSAPPVPSHEVDMPDFDIDDISALIDNLNSGKK